MNLQSSFQSRSAPGGVPLVFSPCRSECVGVASAAGELRLVATRAIAPGEPLFRMEGEPTPHPTRYSLQIGEELHLEVGRGCSAEEIRERFFWRYLNHGCDPNTVIHDRTVIALRGIGAWEDVTFDYETTEYHMAEPFFCRCGSPACRGHIQGFKHLTSAERERLKPRLADHLRRILRRETAGGRIVPPGTPA